MMPVFSRTVKILLVILTVTLIITFVVLVIYYLNTNKSAKLQLSNENNIPQVKTFNVDKDQITKDMSDLGISKLVYLDPALVNSKPIIIKEITFSLDDNVSQADYRPAKDVNSSIGFSIHPEENASTVKIHISQNRLEIDSAEIVSNGIYLNILWALDILGRRDPADAGLSDRVLTLFNDRKSNNLIPVSLTIVEK